MCYFEQPKGHELVIQGMNVLRNATNEYGYFDAWLKMLDQTLYKEGLGGEGEDVKRLITKFKNDTTSIERAVKKNINSYFLHAY
jgi:hypothetical protein